MKKYILHIVILLCLAQLHSQENGVVAFTLPVRNSLKFNKYALHPTFSFVREQNKYITVTNKKQWIQFDNAPQTYLVSYSGRLSENTGLGVGLFQQDYGVFSNFGGILNFAYNAVFNRDSNLTFGANVAFYQSGINEGRVVTNFPDSALNSIEKSAVVTINPGLNYGTAFFDFGISVNNLVSYNLNASELIEDNPEQNIQGHIMYTGYMQNRGFFDNTKFSGLLRTEVGQEETLFSGLMMLTVPKGIWGQIGYHTRYGASVGLGLNISNQIGLEYNYEKSLGKFSGFGVSHEITLAYKFKKKYRYNYSDDDKEVGLFSSSNKRRKSTVKRSKNTQSSESDKERFRANRVASAQKAAERKAKYEAEKLAKAEAVAKAKELAIEKAKQEAIVKAERIAEEKAKAAEVAQAKKVAQEKARAEALAKVERTAEEKARAKRGRNNESTESDNEIFRANRIANAKKAEEVAQAKQLAEAQAKAVEVAQAKQLAEEVAQAKQLVEAQAKAEEVAQAKQLAEAQAKAEEVAQAKQLAEAQAKAEEVAQAKQLAEAQAKAEEVTQAKQLAEAQAKAAEVAQAKQLAEAQAKAEEVAQAKQLAEAQVKAEEVAQAKQLAEAQAKAAEVAQAKQLAEAQAKAEEVAQAKQLAEAQAKAAEVAQAKQLAEAQAKAEEVAQAKQLAEAQAKAAEVAQAKQLAEAQAKAAEVAQAKQLAEAQAKAEEVAQAKQLAEAQAKAKEVVSESQNKNGETSKAKEIADVLGNGPMDAATRAMIDLTKLTDASKIEQRDLLNRLNEKMSGKQKDLDDLKKENDLRDQGIVSAPKPFKSVSAENAALEALKIELEAVINNRSAKIKEIETLYKARLKKVKSKEDTVNMIYLDAIEIFNKEQKEAREAKAKVEETLERIKIATDIERKRRIKKAAYDNEEDRYVKDRAALKSIKQFTEESAIPLKSEDFDFGDIQSNIQIVKAVKNAESGYYMVVAVHSDVVQRDAFLAKAVAAGQSNIDFFFDVTSNKYFIYYEKFNDIESATRMLQSKGTEPYNSKMSMVKIEN
ncbi:PorP/SprF family type IX secretion system membrane protein [Algibacter miyuki]|uniref:PorP/SprF family type IX secretion system membrane protein n=1 Tax=Algibacter miyuki TaxID=1306933 RepID=A0ABV5GZS0_9FLAO|nr:PorP/SprF family type IX secretion system membrane protein [Algibacter miyuki]MDN3666839.1 PorP/SprF family type IX secretion system membrane protein [Algibacter miyuki]